MTDSIMPAIKPLGVQAIQLPHPQAKIWIWRFHQQVIVVIHLTIGMTQPIVFFYYSCQDFQKKLPIGIFEIYFVSAITTGSYVIYCSWIFYS